MIQFEEEIDRLMSKPGVLGIIILSRMGSVIHTTYSDDETEKKAKTVRRLIAVAEEVSKLEDDTNDTQFIRIKTKTYELLVCPSEEYVLVTYQSQEAKNKN
ncbi:hypothetical protein BB559_007178 [Furculomyces boomerangus]|uniref:Roadblock/LAMTOR2 domain-containing protein n=2 Tax=Harpellales TaxID=61421 RepID=A0A2T9XYL0_9FUNG|nr:hypothetical protein BB559_007178 [Furculomyces boomerangus]PVZ99927.1 hypothetical protein BB558_004041 [Smittium angustum]